jgi:iron complex outermembrane receptor protein
MKKIFLYLSCIFVFLSGYAQQRRDTVYQEPVTIKGRIKTVKERGEFKRHGQSTEVLTHDELERNNPMFIEHSLNTMAGVQVDKRTQLGGQRIVIRGYGNDQKFNNWGIKAYYNGVPITTADGVTVLDDIDFGIVNNIEVIKGPAATMYGGGVGGVARFYLKNEDRQGVTFQQKLITGSFGLLQSNSRIDLVNNNTSTSFSYGYLTSDGYRPHGSSDKNYLTVYSDIRISEKEKLNVFASHNHSVEKVSGQISYADYYAGIDNGNAAYIRKDAKNDFTSDRFSISHQYMFNPNFSNSTSFFYSHGDYTSISAGAYGNSANPNFGIRSVFNLKSNLSKTVSNDLSFGTELQKSKSLASSYRFTGTNNVIPLQVQDITKGSFFKNTNNQSAVFFFNRISFKPLNLSVILGLSSNKISFNRIDLLANPGLLSTYNKDLGFKKSFKATLNPHIAVQKIYKNQIFNVSYSEGYNAPTAAISLIGTINKTNDSLLPERAKMIDISLQGLLLDTKLDYQLSWFRMNITDKLTQLNGKDPVTGTAYSYWSNTGLQNNQGLEASIGYVYTPAKKSFISKIEPFFSLSQYHFKYKQFSTKAGANVVDYSGKRVVGLPTTKFSVGFDIKTVLGLYMNNTITSLNSVYTDFGNTNKVKGFSLYNAKLGFKKSFANDKLDLDIYVAGNNLTGSINYTFLFLGNNINDADPGNGYPAGVTTDVNPGASKACFFGGVTVKCHLGK